MEHDGVATLVGCGGAGVNFVSRMGSKCRAWAKVYALAADALHLATVHTKNSLLLGPMTLLGRGAGGDFKLAERAAEESKPNFLKMVEGSKLVFVVVGLAGTTGTAAAVLISRLAREKGLRAIAIGILPFAEEGPEANLKAREGLAKLRDTCDLVVVAKNDQLTGISPKMDIGKAFRSLDEVLAEEARRIASSTGDPVGGFLRNVEFLDIRVPSTNVR